MIEINNDKKRTCIIYTKEEFEELMKKAVDNHPYFEVDDYPFLSGEYTCFEDIVSDFEDKEINEILSVYLETHVTSVHSDNNFYKPTIWVVYDDNYDHITKEDIIEIAKESFETGHWIKDFDFETFESINNWKYYNELMELGPWGFYSEFQGKLEFDDSFREEYGD